MIIWNLVILWIIVTIIDLALAGSLNWIGVVFIILAVLSLGVFTWYKLSQYRDKLRIRRLVWYQQEHPNEVPTFLEIMKQKGLESEFLEKTYYKELRKYERLHKVEPDAIT